MLISRQYKFIFIHIYKNAGTSISHALMPFALSGPQRLAWELFSGTGQVKINRLFGKFDSELNPQPWDIHIHAQQLIKNLGEKPFGEYFSFAFVRNPWDWQVSLYKYMCKNPQHPQHALAKTFTDFDDYLAWRCSEEVRFQKDFIYSPDGELLVNFVGRYENLQQDFQAICKRIGISATLPKMNVSNAKPFQQFYHADSRALVEKTFAADIDLFDYRFDP